MKCKNCGAELNSGKCEYCGSIFSEDMNMALLPLLKKGLDARYVLEVSTLIDSEPHYIEGV